MTTRTWIRIACLTALALLLHGTAWAAPDAWITTKVKLALLTTDGVPGTAINVDTVDGRVTLQGTVPTATEKSRAEHVAKDIDGVKQVRNLIAIAPLSDPVEQQEVADDVVRAAVADALRQDSALADSDVEVTNVAKGVVTLGGSAESMSAELRAVQTARAVPGVRGVREQIEAPATMGDGEVWGEAKGAGERTAGAASDLWVTSAVKVKLIANTDTPATDINVDTRNGVVTLFGMVPTQAASDAAAAAARGTSGVRDVRNALQVVAASAQERVKASDEQIKEAVETRVDGDAIADADIAVEVSDGVVRLTGTVPSHSDRLQALQLARAADGVRSVVDELRIATN